MSVEPVYCVFDFETFSEADLKKVGAFEYSYHSSTEILCAAWRVGTLKELRSAKTKWWVPGQVENTKAEFVDCLLDPGITLVAHNAYFEQCIVNNVMWLPIPSSRYLCTAARAAAMALPRKLELACLALDLPVKKDMEGHRLMLKWSKPRKPSKNNPKTRHDNIEELRRIVKYCVGDIAAEVELLLNTQPLTAEEQKVWILDQEINFRGVMVDRALIKKTLSLVEEETANLQHQIFRLTNGAVRSARQHAAFLRYLNGDMCFIKDLTKTTIDKALKDEGLEPRHRELLECRQAASKSSTAKYIAFEMRSRFDSRVRDSLVYHAASTGRWGGSGVQLQNLPRPTIKDEFAHRIIKDCDLETIRLLYGKPMELFSSCIRNVIVAPPGKTLDIADYSAIEVRVLFWIAGNTAGLTAYRMGKDLYKDMASQIYRISESEVNSDQRWMGKTTILACLAKDTPVLTTNGFKPIQNISKRDRVWDGAEWVTHKGRKFQGRKSVIKIESQNIEATPDHRFWKNGMWQTAVEIVLEEHTQLPKLEKPSEMSPSLVRNSNMGLNAVSMCAAYAELKRRLELTDCGVEKNLIVSCVNNLWPDKKVETPTEIAMLLVIQGLERVGKLVTETSKNGAVTPMIKTSRGMAVEEFRANSDRLGRFWNILLHWMGLINPGSPWTELITTEVINPETYESYLKKLTTRTEDTYDLIDCGPRKCFQVNSLISHNCGYGMGFKKFMLTCENLGRKVSEEFAMLAVQTYREQHSAVPEFWRTCEKAAMHAVRHKDKKFRHNMITWYMRGKFLVCELPSKRCLYYYNPIITMEKMPWGEIKPVLRHYGVDSISKKWQLQKTWGGTLVENVVQAISRDLMAAAMLRINATKTWDLVLSVHDELIAERDIHESSIDEFCRLMSIIPEWAVGCPIGVEGFTSERYRK